MATPYFLSLTLPIPYYRAARLGGEEIRPNPGNPRTSKDATTHTQFEKIFGGKDRVGK
jgi:hypothetical protein